jgi:hypothetical protein
MRAAPRATRKSARSACLHRTLREASGAHSTPWRASEEKSDRFPSFLRDWRARLASTGRSGGGHALSLRYGIKCIKRSCQRGIIIGSGSYRCRRYKRRDQIGGWSLLRTSSSIPGRELNTLKSLTGYFPPHYSTYSPLYSLPNLLHLHIGTSTPLTV